MTDTDAPGFVHWVVAGLDPATTSLGEGAVPEDAIVALNSAGGLGYTGPCPPAGGGVHRYVVSVHFLATATEIESGALGEDLLAVVEDCHVRRGLTGGDVLAGLTSARARPRWSPTMRRRVRCGRPAPAGGQRLTHAASRCEPSAQWLTAKSSR